MEKVIGILGKFIEFKKMSPPQIAGTIIFSTLLFMILPESLFGVGKASIPGIVFLLSVGFLSILFIAYIKDKISYSVSEREYLKIAEKEVENLDPREIEILKKFYTEDRQTIEFLLYDTVISGLLNRKILYPTSHIYRTYYSEIYVNCSITKAFKSLLDKKFK